GQPGVAAPLGVRDLGVAGGEPLDVHLVDDGVVHGDVRMAVPFPVEVRVDDDRLGDVRAAVGVVGDVLFARPVRETRPVPVDVAVDGAGVGVDQQLVGIAAQAR